MLATKRAGKDKAHGGRRHDRSVCNQKLPPRFNGHCVDKIGQRMFSALHLHSMHRQDNLCRGIQNDQAAGLA